MGTAAFIAGDWGTTHLRLTLCDAAGHVLETGNGPGVSQIQGRFAEVFAELTASWTREQGSLPAVLCGMVGSTIGWTNVPYVTCPSAPARIADAMAAVANGSVLIAPGLSCRNRHGAPDVLRGEETQILGALHLDNTLRTGQHLLCLPGTHTKWVVLEEGVVREFLTSVTGELFAVVNEHSVLIRSDSSTDPDAAAIFQAAIDHVQQYPDAALSQLLFECRSRQVMGQLSRAAAPHYLSGLLIAHDIAGACRIFADVLQSAGTVTLVGTPHLMELHARTFAGRSVRTTQVDGAHASLAGLAALYAHRSDRKHTDAA